MELTVNSNREAIFLAGVLEGEKPIDAAKKAGYSTPQRDAFPLMSKPEVRKYFKKVIIGRGETEGVAIAYKFLIETIRDEEADKRLRVDCAKFIYGQHIPAPKAIEAAGNEDKSPSEMTNEELRQFIEKGEAELANRAEPTQGLDSML